MGAEYEQITRQLPFEYQRGGEIVRGVVKTLVDQGLLPPALHVNEPETNESSFPKDWPKIEFVKPADASPYVTELDALNIPLRARNALRRNHVARLDQLLAITDEQLMRLRNIGTLTLEGIHSGVENFRGYVIETRRIGAVPDDLPLLVQLPKKPVI